MTESRRALLRISSNYVRLIGSTLMGLLVVRFLLRAVGSDAVGLVLLLGYTMGLATVIEESVENSMVRELGRAHHSGDVREFRRMFNSSLAVSVGAAVCSLGMFAIILAVLPLLEIGPGLLGAARWFILAKSLESVAIIICAPAYNMYLVTERMASVNAWMLARKACGLIAATVTLLSQPQTPSEGLILYAWVNAILHVMTLAAAAGFIMWRDPRLVPSPRLADRAACAEIVRTSGMNMTIYATQLLQVPACSVLMNLAFGLHGNFIFGLAVQLAGYVRMLANGFVAGIEAVTARIASEGTRSGEPSKLQALAYHATRLQGFVAVPAAAGLFVIVPTFLHVWLTGKGVDNAALREASVLARLLVFGILAQCVLDVWWRMLYGAGFVRHYARPFAIAAIATTPLAWLLLQVLPGSLSQCGPAIAYATLNLLLAAAFMPRIVARCFDVSANHLLVVIARPVVPAVIAAVASAMVDRWLAPPSIISLLAAMAAFAVAYALFAYPLVLENRDRQRLAGLYRRVRFPVQADIQSSITEVPRSIDR